MATVMVEYFGMDGTGKNVTEAKRDAGRKIEAALTGSYTPETLSWRGWTILVYREPDGWHTAIVADPTFERNGPACGSYRDGDKQDALKAARCQLAQLGWTHEDGQTAPEFLKDRAELAGFLDWVTFQQRYRRAKQAGLDSNDAHAYGCGAHFKPELVALVEGPKEAVNVA